MSMAEEATPVEVDEAARTSTPPSTPECSPPPSPVPIEEHMCHICEERFKQPRLLSCLHEFCTECLEKQLEGEDGSSEPAGTITCPECKQETKVSSKGVAHLQQDHVLMNMMDMSAIEDMQIICQSCKAKEKAVARCTDCANFLCPNCVTAHQYMRCFENHKVVSFEELRSEDGMSLHKPLFCATHQSESMKYFCHTCQIPICNECIVAEHKQPDHIYERITDIKEKQVEEIQGWVSETKGKIEFCEHATNNLEGSLRDLQMQRDNVSGLIEETFQSYRAFLEKRQKELLAELEELHTSHELAIMEMFHNVEKTIEKIEDSTKITERVLEHGNIIEILTMKKLISSQLLSLINNTPGQSEVSVKIDFLTDADKFEQAVRDTFGSFKGNEEEQLLHETPAASLHSSFENEGITLPAGLLGPDVMPPVPPPEFLPDLHSLPPIAIPKMPTPSSNIVGVSAHTMNSIASSIQNLAHVAGGGPERSSSRNSYSPAMSDSGISVDAASNSSGSNQPPTNLAVLAKHGPVSVNPQGLITLNGQVIPGLNINNVTGLPPPCPISQPRPSTPTADPSIANLLNSMNMNPAAATSRAQTPQLNELAGLLSQTSPPLGMAVLGVGANTGASSAMSHNGGMPPMNGMPPPCSTSYGAGGGIHQHPPLPVRSGKMSAMQIRCKFGQLGPGKGQFNSPHGFCLGMDEDIIVADTNNHRIQVFEKTGEFKYQFGIPGREEGQLWYPRKVAVIRHSGKYVVCDRGNERSRMQIFTKNGHFIKKIAIRYIDIVAGLAVTPQGHIVAVDSVSPTVFVIGESGDLIKWFDCSDYMREPSDIAVNGKEYFVCDFKGHCVVVFNEEGQFMRRIGCENITNYPNGIDISDAGDVLVGDSHGNRFHVAVFQRDGSLIGEFECPYVKVSRCCGLKITSEGYVVTLAKNNHHVLVLNTLYIT